MKKIISAFMFSVTLVAIGSCSKDDDSGNGGMYKCDNGNCVESSDGIFNSKSDCEATCGSAANLVDIDGNSYGVVTIGNQIWMGENLRVTHYNDGTPINQITDNNQWEAAFLTAAWCNYSNDSALGIQYGRLYNWGAVNTGKLCPTGWHIPTSEEWDELIDYLGGENEAGGKMKTTTGWSAPNEGATNESNFSALPAGYRYFNFGGFMEMFETTQFWTSTPSSRNNYFNNVYLHNWSEKAFTFYARPNSGFSCRCIKD